MKPFVLKVRWAPSSRNESAARNAEYIGNRPGVVREPEPDRGSPAAVYARYAATRPGSRGLFAADPDHPPDLHAVTHELRHSNSPTWRVILSLRGEDAESLGYSSLSDWQGLTRRHAAGLERSMGLQPGQLRWVAAHHQARNATGVEHPHVHILAWLSPDAQARQGRLSAEELRAARREAAREVYGPLRAQHTVERTAGRDEALKIGKDLLERVRAERAGREAAEREVLVGVPSAETLARIGSRLEALGRHLPEHGRLALAFMPEPVKAEAREIAADLLRSRELRPAVQQYEGATRDLSSLYTTQQPDSDAALNGAHEDLRDRVAQQVLRAAAAVHHDEQFAARRQMQPVEALADAYPEALVDDESRARLAEALAALPVERDDEGHLHATDSEALDRAVDVLLGPAAAEPLAREDAERIVAEQVARLAGPLPRPEAEWIVTGQGARVGAPDESRPPVAEAAEGEAGVRLTDKEQERLVGLLHRVAESSGEDRHEAVQEAADLLQLSARRGRSVFDAEADRDVIRPWHLEGSAPSSAAEAEAGARLTREERQQLADLLRQAAGLRGGTDLERAAAAGRAADLLQRGAQARQDADRARAAREVVHQAARVQRGVRDDAQWSRVGAAQTVVSRAGGVLRSEYGRAVARAERAREHVAERAEERARRERARQMGLDR